MVHWCYKLVAYILPKYKGISVGRKKWKPLNIWTRNPTNLLGPMLWSFKYFRWKIRRKNLAFLTQSKSKIYKILTITLVFEKNANFFRRKLTKIAENCDHNVDPWLFDDTWLWFDSKQSGSLTLRDVISRVARWFVFKPKTPIWVNFGRP
jgi:hypothetical protein